MYIYKDDPRFEDMLYLGKCINYDGFVWKLQIINGDWIYVMLDVCPDYGEGQDGETTIQYDRRRQSDFQKIVDGR